MIPGHTGMDMVDTDMDMDMVGMDMDMGMVGMVGMVGMDTGMVGMDTGHTEGITLDTYLRTHILKEHQEV